jgi:hypothetical protein
MLDMPKYTDEFVCARDVAIVPLEIMVKASTRMQACRAFLICFHPLLTGCCHEGGFQGCFFNFFPLRSSYFGVTNTMIFYKVFCKLAVTSLANMLIRFAN